MAMSVESAVDNIKRNMGNASAAFENFANTQAKALGMARKDAYTYGSTFSNLLSSFISDTGRVASETQDIMKAAAVIASKTGRTFEDVAGRIRSGMLGSTEAIEDLGAYTNISMIESTEAFKKFANGKSWNQLDFRVQQQIRLAAILEQAYSRYGDTLANTTQTKQAMFLASLQNIKLNLGQAFLPIYNAILPALTAFSNALENITARFAAFSEALFGKANSVQTISNQTKAVTDLGNATEKAGKKAKGALAGFDQLNILQPKEATAGAGAGEVAGITSTEIATPASQILDIKTDIDTSGIEKFREMIQPTVEAVQKLQKALEPLKSFTSQALSDFYNSFLVPIAQWTFGEGLPRFIDAISNGLAAIDWSKINGALNTLWQALAPFAINVGEGLLWFWENVLAPLGTWTMNNVVPVFLEISANAITILNNAIDALKPLGQWLWDNFLLPVAKWTGGIIVDVLEAISDALKAIGDWIKKHQKTVETFAIIVGSFAVAWALVNGAITAWNVIGAIAAGVTTVFGAAVAFLTSPVTLTIAAIAALIAIVVLLIRNWDTVKEVAGNCWESIKGAWNAAGEWFKTSITEPIKNAFASAWESTKNAWSTSKSFFGSVWGGIKGAFGNVSDWFKNTFADAWSKVKTVFAVGGAIFDGIKEGISDTFKTVVNALICGINKIISVPFKAINGMLNKIRNVNVLGITPFSGLWKENPLAVPQIPKLAKGGIVDSPTLAMIGEAGKEAVVPLENTSFVTTLASAIANEISKKLNNKGADSSSNKGDIVLKIGDVEFGRIAIKAINEVQRSAGATLLIV
jgi:hypothetical protein